MQDPAVAQTSPLPRRFVARQLPSLLVVLVGVFAWWGVWRNEFLFDDLPAIVDSEALRAGDWWGAAFGERHQPFANRPLASLSLALDAAVFGSGPFGPHLTSLLLHLGNALLLLAVLRRALQAPNLAGRFDGARATWLAATVAALWVAHPLGADAVAYATQRSTVLAAGFLLLALYATLRAHPASARRWRTLVVLALAAGMASKEDAVTGPLLVVLFERAFLLPSWSALRVRVAWYAVLASTWSVLLVCLWLGPHNPTVGFATRSGITAWQWLLTQASVLVHYLRLTVWPQGLRGAYDWGATASLLQAALPGACILLVLGLSLAAWRRRPWWGWLAALCFLLLAPTSTILPIETEIAAERRMYLPMLSVLVTIVVAGERLLVAWVPRRRHWLAVVPVAGAVLALALATQARVRVYRDSAAFWTDADAKRTPGSRTFLAGLILSNHGDAEYRAGRIEAACALYDAAMDCDGPTANAIGRYALSLLVRGRHAEAVTVMRRLVQSDPDPHAWGMLGLCLTVSHEAAVGTADDPRLAEAEIALRRGLADRPDEWQFVAALGYVLRVQGRLAEAEHAYRRVTEAVTGEADPFFARAALLQQLDRQAEIGPLFALLAAARPLDVELRLRIATFEFQRGDHAAAKRMLQDVLHLDPGNQPAIAGLRTLEAASGR